MGAQIDRSAPHFLLISLFNLESKNTDAETGHLQPAGLPSLSAPYDSHAVCLWAFLWGSGARQGQAGAFGVLVVVQ